MTIDGDSESGVCWCSLNTPASWRSPSTTIFGTAVSGAGHPASHRNFLFHVPGDVLRHRRLPWGVTEPQKNFGKVLLYISFFPQLIAGPIVKYHDVEQEIETPDADGADGVSKRYPPFYCWSVQKSPDLQHVMGMTADALFGAAARDARGSDCMGGSTFLFIPDLF